VSTSISNVSLIDRILFPSALLNRLGLLYSFDRILAILAVSLTLSMDWQYLGHDFFLAL